MDYHVAAEFKSLKAGLVFATLVFILGLVSTAWIMWNGPPGGNTIAIVLLVGLLPIAVGSYWLLSDK